MWHWTFVAMNEDNQLVYMFLCRCREVRPKCDVHWWQWRVDKGV